MCIKMKVSVTAQWLGTAKPGLVLSAYMVSHQIPSEVFCVLKLLIEFNAVVSSYIFWNWVQLNNSIIVLKCCVAKGKTIVTVFIHYLAK